MPNVYTKDSTVTISNTFTLTGTATDPTTVTCYFKDPTGALTTYVYGTNSQLVRDSTGAYHVDIFANIAGNWWYRFEGTGTVVSASEAEFIVPLSQIL
jgi:hypothetical protein